MHNAEHTEARLCYSTVSGLTPLLDARFHVQIPASTSTPSFWPPSFLFLRHLADSGLRGSLHSLIGESVLSFLELLLLMPRSRRAT